MKKVWLTTLEKLYYKTHRKELEALRLLAELKIHSEKLEATIENFKDGITIPKKKTPAGSDIFNDYVNGWNDCVDEIKKLNEVE